MKKLLFVFTAFLVVMFCNTYKVEAADNSIWLHGKEFTWTDDQTIITVGGTQVLIGSGKITKIDSNSGSRYNRYYLGQSSDLWTYSNDTWSKSSALSIQYNWTNPSNPATISYTSDSSKVVWYNYLGSIESCPYAEEPPVRFDPDVAYVTKCYGYEKYFQKSTDPYAKLDLGIDLSNNNYDRVDVQFYVAFPTSDTVQALEQNGFSYTKSLPKQVYDFLRSPEASKYFVDSFQVFDKSRAYTVQGFLPVSGKYFVRSGASSSKMLSYSWEDIIPYDDYANYTVWNTQRFWGWFKHFQEIAYLTQVRITCYKDDIPGPTSVIKFTEFGEERYEENFNPAKSLVAFGVTPDQVDTDSDDYKQQESQSAAEIEREYQQEQHRQEILDKEIADAAGVGSIGGSLNGIVSEIPSMTSGIKNAVAALFAPFNYLPGEIRGLFLATVIILCAIAIIKFIRG